MRTYYAQLADVETPAAYRDDGDPVLGTADEYGHRCWQSKQGEHVVAQLKPATTYGTESGQSDRI